MSNQTARPWPAISCAMIACAFVLTACERRADPALTDGAPLVSAAADTLPRSAPPDTTAPARTEVPPGDLIDPSIEPAVAGEDGWDYHQSIRIDLDGDGDPERVVITARVELVRGRPAWDDGQPWQVYVEEPEGGRTYLYASRLQLGTLTMRIAVGESSRPAGVVLLEHLPERMRLFEIEYHGPGSVRVSEVFNRRLDPTGELASPSLP